MYDCGRATTDMIICNQQSQLLVGFKVIYKRTHGSQKLPTSTNTAEPAAPLLLASRFDTVQSLQQVLQPATTVEEPAIASSCSLR
jgi:hypothetical protein